MMSTVTLLALAVFTALWCASQGVFLTPTAYTLPGVMAVNGSSANGGCPPPCVGVISGITTCDCGTHSTIGEEAITGVLIDGVIPTIDIIERNTANEFVWAAPLFTVRGSADTVTLGFRFSASVALREVELYLFYCPTWGIGAESIVIHNGASFPQFFQVYNSIGSVNLTMDNNNCTSLTVISIPLDTERSTSSYFIEFTNPSGDPIEWVHIAEVRFSDQPITTTMATSNPTTETQTTAASSTTEETTTNATVSTTGTATLTTNTTDETVSTTGAATQTTAQDVPTSTFAALNATTSISETSGSAGGQSVAVVGAVVGVIVALVIIILVLGAVVIVGCIVGRKRRSYRTEVEHLQDVVLERNNTNGTDKSSIKLNALETKTTSENSHYQKPQFDMKARSQSSPPSHIIVPPEEAVITDGGAQYSKLRGGAAQPKLSGGVAQIDETGYSDVAILASSPTSDIYDDIIGADASDVQYSTIDNCAKKKQTKSDLQVRELDSSVDFPQPREAAYSIVLKIGSPLIPSKTPELYTDLKREGEEGKQKVEAEDEHYTEVDENLKKGILASKARATPTYAEPADNLEEEEPANYSSIKDTAKASTPITLTDGAPLGDFSELECGRDIDDVYSEVDNVLSKNRGTSGSQATSSAVVDDMVSNMMYDSADVLVRPVEANTQDDDTIYTNPDTSINSGENIYDVVYSESIKPSMFVKSPKIVKGAFEQSSESTEQEDDEEEAVYAPIYSLTSSMSSSNLLQLKPENIHKIKTLGTGFFGKVLLADTVGLSPKDLKMSETDDDKTKSVRVAVKTLRLNPSPERRETFEKELKFMSRLTHPNVVRTLGACAVDTQFIVMEYMEKGDLNQYLQDFDSITEGNATPTNLTISVGTLIYMSAQIADAMKYLASRNYIHRDLATRNCLVGAESRIKIADFGMSKNLYESHYYIIKGQAILPVRWMARECFYGRFSAKTDVWAFGVTMWEMFTLAKDIPYEDMDDSEVAADGSRLNGHRQLLERPKDCPEDMYAVMLMCWRKEPGDRAMFDKLHETLLAIKVRD